MYAKHISFDVYVRDITALDHKIISSNGTLTFTHNGPDKELYLRPHNTCTPARFLFLKSATKGKTLRFKLKGSYPFGMTLETLTTILKKWV